MTIISAIVGKNPLEEMECHHSQPKALNAVLWYNLKSNRMISIRFQDKSFNITVIQVYAPTTDAEEAEVDLLYEDLQHLLEHQKKMSYSS